MRRGFTLIELMISITILSIVMLFLYQSYSSLNKTNKLYDKETNKIQTKQMRKKIMFLDFSLVLSKDITIINQNRKEDVVFLQSSHSMHDRYNPYIAYIVKDSKLYRLESLKKFKRYPLDADIRFSLECFGEIESFRVYRSKKKNHKMFLLHVTFKDEEDILLKINSDPNILDKT